MSQYYKKINASMLKKPASVLNINFDQPRYVVECSVE